MEDEPNPILNEILIQKATRARLVGFYWFLAGSAVSLVSYFDASPGESYVIFWGAPVFGLIRMYQAHELLVKLAGPGSQRGRK